MSQTSEESSFDRMVEEIQRQIIEDERATYSQKVIEEYYNPKNLGRMSAPDAVGIVHGWCSDTMEIYLRMNGSRIEEATFMTDGCGPKEMGVRWVLWMLICLLLSTPVVNGCMALPKGGGAKGSAKMSAAAQRMRWARPAWRALSCARRIARGS